MSTRTIEFIPDTDLVPFVIRTKPQGEAVAIMSAEHLLFGNNTSVFLYRHGYFLSDGGIFKQLLGRSPYGLWCIELITVAEFKTLLEFDVRDISSEVHEAKKFDRF